MLERLVIRDLAVVERAEVTFGPGLNVVTGETGAGKSLLVQAINLLIGERADADVVRDGAAATIVEAEFRLTGEVASEVVALLAEWGLEIEGESLIVRREVQESGRSRATVNHSPVTLAALKRVGERLADLHGQHEHQSLLRPDAGLLTLDRLGGHAAERARYDQALVEWQKAQAALDTLRVSLATFQERREAMREALEELRDAKLVEGEEERLARDGARLAHADRLRGLAGAALESLSEADSSAAARLGIAVRALEQASALDPSLADVPGPLREAEILVADTARVLAGYLDGLEADPHTLEAVEARRDRIARLTRKHHRNLAELIAWSAELERDLAAGEDADHLLAEAQARAERTEEECLAAGRKLTRARKKAAAEWGPRLGRELRALGFANATLEFAVDAALGDAPTPGASGLDTVALEFAPNRGEPPRPLQKIASGGELSRVMLGLKVALEARDPVDVLVFDEVDSGIGGAVAQAVGERLRGLSRHRQIVCVTHLPMIAAMAQHHLRVTKTQRGNRTLARIEAVEGEERVLELSRMLAGERTTETTRRQARELLGSAAGPLAR